LQAAAVIGTEVPLPLLEAIAELPEVALHRGLAHLQAAEFLYETRLFPERAYTFKHALTQQVAYQSLLTSTRQRYHQQLAQVLAAHPETVETQPERLAHHYSEAGLAAPAVAYWQRAGQRASERSAILEAISHFTRGLEILQTLPDTAERAQHELRLQTVLASAYIAVKGQGAWEVEQAYSRAHVLCQQVGDTPQLIPVLQGLRRFYTARAEYQRVRELGEQLLRLAQSLHDPVAFVEGHLSLGLFLWPLGELREARTHLEQGIAHYDPQQHRALTVHHGRDPGVLGRYMVALVLWALGYPSQAVQQSHDAIILAQELSHAYSLARALSAATLLRQFLRAKPAVQEQAEALIALATEQGFALPLAEGTILRGCALVEQGQGETGIAQMRQGIATLQAIGAEAHRLPYLALLAEAHGKAGHAEEGLAVLAEGLAVVEKTGARNFEAELYRLQGELLLRQAAPDAPQAASCFQQALNITRHQQAKTLELRAAVSLSRLWQQQGKRAEARDLLTPIYGWFTEGFDTADLQEAKALLEGLT
jgi:predicted ATPase